jgi:hypothetical protein
MNFSFEGTPQLLDRAWGIVERHEHRNAWRACTHSRLSEHAGKRDFFFSFPHTLYPTSFDNQIMVGYYKCEYFASMQITFVGEGVGTAVEKVESMVALVSSSEIDMHPTEWTSYQRMERVLELLPAGTVTVPKEVQAAIGMLRAAKMQTPTHVVAVQ